MKYVTDEMLKEKIDIDKCCLLGQISLTEEEEEWILNYAKNVFNFNEINDDSNLVLSVALVLVAINDYQDGKYWEMVENKFEINDFSSRKQGILGRMFINTLKKYNLFELPENENKAMKFVENIKAHAFVTNNYMDRFYEFLTDYYENNLFRDITEDVEDTLQDLSDFIKSTINQKDDTIFGDNSNGKAKKSYKLLKSTREVIAGCDGDVLYQLFYPLLKMIDINFYDGILPRENSGRFSDGYIEWSKKNNTSVEEKKSSGRTRKIYSKKPYLVMKPKENYFELIIPKQRFRSTECDGKVIALITINGQTVKRELEVSTNMGTYITEETKFPMEYPFDEVYIIFKSKEDVEARIPEKNYVIFNEEFIRKDKLEKGMNYVLVKKDCQVKLSEETMLQEQIEKDEWTIYCLDIGESSVFYVDEIPLTVMGEFSKNPVFENEITTFDVFKEDNQKIIAASLHPMLFVEINKGKEIGTTIKINEKNYSLKDRRFHIYDSPIDTNQIIIASDLNSILDKKNGYYKVELNVLGESNKLITEYLLLNRVKFFFDKYRYTYEEDGYLTLKTGGVNIEILDKECELTYTSEYTSNYYYTFKLNKDYGHINAKIELEDKTYKTKFEIPMLQYGFSKEEMIYGQRRKIWHSNLKGIMYMKLPGAKKLGVYLDNKVDDVTWGDKVKEDIFKIDMNEKIKEIHSDNSNFNTLGVKFIDNKERTMYLVKVEKNVFIEPYFKFENYDGIIGFDVNFEEHEGTKIFFTVENAVTKQKIIERRELKNGFNILKEINEYDKYNIYPILEENDEFGFNTKTVEMKPRFNVVLNRSKKENRDLSEIIGTQFFINEILYEGEKIPINFLYAYKIELNKRNEYGDYEAQLYEYNLKYHNSEMLAKNNRIDLGKINVKYAHEFQNTIYLYINFIMKLGVKERNMCILYQKINKRLTGYTDVNPANEENFKELDNKAVFIVKIKEKENDI